MPPEGACSETSMFDSISILLEGAELRDVQLGQVGALGFCGDRLRNPSREGVGGLHGVGGLEGRSTGTERGHAGVEDLQLTPRLRGGVPIDARKAPIREVSS